MAEYYVTVPIAGKYEVVVDADSEEDAINKAIQLTWTVKLETECADGPQIDDYELESFRHIVEGKPYGEQPCRLNASPTAARCATAAARRKASSATPATGGESCTARA